MSAFSLRDSLAVLDVDAGKLAFLDQFPFNALPFSYDATAAATKAILDAAEQFVNLPVASYHGALTLSTLSISRAPTSAACKACGPLQRIDGRTGDVPACVCEFGYARAADTCSPLTRTISAKTTTSVSNAAPVEVRLTSTESLGYGGAMRCVFGVVSVSAYWRAANEVACVIEPSKSISPAKYDVKFFFTAATAGGGVAVGGQVDVVDGAALCGAATTCGQCDKSACVYCADGARQCVPGTVFGGPVGQCGNWFSRSCPDFVLSIDGAPQRASILAGNTHTYSFVVPSGTKEDVRVDVLSYPREVQMNSEVSLLMRRGQAPAITGSNNGVPVGMWDFANLTDKVPRGDFHLQQCDLGEGTYYVTVISQRPYSYDIRLNLACGCASSSGGQTPRITALTPSIGALVSPADTVRSVDIAGSDFSNALQRLLCKFESGSSGIPVYSVAQVSGGGGVQCQVPSFDEAPDKDSRSKAPGSGRVSVSNNRCGWSNELVYRQYLNVVLGDQRTRAAAPPRSGVPTRLPVGQADYYRLDTRELGVAAVSFFARQLEPGALALYVMPQDARDAALACGGSVRCAVRGSGSLASEYRLSDCALEAGVWYFVVANNGTAPVGYLAGSECGCGDETPIGSIKSVEPIAGNVLGYDVLTIRGSGFQNATAKRCVFGDEGESPAQFVSSAEVRCVSVPQLSAARPRNVRLTVEGDSRGTLANRPCAKSTEFSFPYYVQLNRGQSFSAPIDTMLPSFFVFDLSQSVAVVQRRRQEAKTESFKVTLTPSNVIRRYQFDVVSGSLPERPTTESVKGEQSKLFCHVPVTSRFYIGVWSSSDTFNMKVAISDPPECLNMTASPLPIQTTMPMTTNNGSKSIVFGSLMILIIIAAFFL